MREGEEKEVNEEGDCGEGRRARTDIRQHRTSEKATELREETQWTTHARIVGQGGSVKEKQERN